MAVGVGAVVGEFVEAVAFVVGGSVVAEVVMWGFTNDETRLSNCRGCSCT